MTTQENFIDLTTPEFIDVTGLPEAPLKAPSLARQFGQAIATAKQDPHKGRTARFKAKVTAIQVISATARLRKRPSEFKKWQKRTRDAAEEGLREMNTPASQKRVTRSTNRKAKRVNRKVARKYRK